MVDEGLKIYRVSGYYIGTWSLEVPAKDEAEAIHTAANQAVSDPEGLDVNIMEVDDAGPDIR